jgi:hypothetical protein
VSAAFTVRTVAALAVQLLINLMKHAPLHIKTQRLMLVANGEATQARKCKAIILVAPRFSSYYHIKCKETSNIRRIAPKKIARAAIEHERRVSALRKDRGVSVWLLVTPQRSTNGSLQSALLKKVASHKPTCALEGADPCAAAEARRARARRAKQECRRGFMMICSRMYENRP